MTLHTFLANVLPLGACYSVVQYNHTVALAMTLIHGILVIDWDWNVACRRQKSKVWFEYMYGSGISSDESQSRSSHLP